MLRELQTTTGKVYDAMNTAAVAMVVGMGVVKDYTNKEVKFPAEATDKGIFFVTKEKRAEGIYAGLGEFSDYAGNDGGTYVDEGANGYYRMMFLYDFLNSAVGKPVYNSEEHCFTNITIPSSVTMIQKSAFEGCTNLEGITFEAEELVIDDRAFYGIGIK